MQQPVFLLMPVRLVMMQFCNRSTIVHGNPWYFFLKLFRKPRGVIGRLRVNFLQYASQLVIFAILLMVGNLLCTTITLFYATPFFSQSRHSFPPQLRHLKFTSPFASDWRCNEGEDNLVSDCFSRRILFVLCKFFENSLLWIF